MEATGLVSSAMKKRYLIIVLILSSIYFSFIFHQRQKVNQHRVQYKAYVFLNKVAYFSEAFYEKHQVWPSSIEDINSSFEELQHEIDTWFDIEYYGYYAYSTPVGFGEVFLSEEYVRSVDVDEDVKVKLKSMSIRFPRKNNDEYNNKSIVPYRRKWF